MVTEHQEKNICGLLFLGKQAYQPASKASDFRSRIFINLASSSQFIQYFIFILCHIAYFLSCYITSCCILEVILLECFFHIINLFLARFCNAYSLTCDVLQESLIKGCAFIIQAVYETFLNSFVHQRLYVSTVKTFGYQTDRIQCCFVKVLLLVTNMNLKDILSLIFIRQVNTEYFIKASFTL